MTEDERRRLKAAFKGFRLSCESGDMTGFIPVDTPDDPSSFRANWTAMVNRTPCTMDYSEELGSIFAYQGQCYR